MASINGSSKSGMASFVAKWVAVEPHEIKALVTSFFMFFAVLAAYYIVRPVRDEMGVTIGKGGLNYLFTVVFFVMLAAVPLFGFVASKFPRRTVLPGLYGFFVTGLIAFWLVFRTDGVSQAAASVFFVFASVFNLFVVSLFWSLMAELWTNAEAKRLYGFISAGGTAGAFAGPLLARELVGLIAPTDLLLVSSALLVAALAASLMLRGLKSGHGEEEAKPAGGGIFDGAAKLLSSPYLARIALFVFIANIVGTFFYLEQTRLVGLHITDSAERVRFFSSRDLIVSILTITIEIFGTAAVLRRFGVTVALAALPVVATLGTLALSFDPGLWMVGAVLVAERVTAFALSSPAIKVMYTLTSADEKYKVQNFVDTVVYRGGDAVAGWLFPLIAGSAGFASGLVPAVALPLTIAWFWTALKMGDAHSTASLQQKQ
jgi:ATP:ADP antiporter, AAA family